MNHCVLLNGMYMTQFDKLKPADHQNYQLCDNNLIIIIILIIKMILILFFPSEPNCLKDFTSHF